MNYLPIGSVVSRPGGSQPLMIYGRKQINTKDDTQWDYVACMYPEGSIGDEYTIFFDRDDIEQVIFKGFQTKIDLEMQKILNQKEI